MKSHVLFLAIVMGMQHPHKDHQEIMDYALEQVRQMSTTHYSDKLPKSQSCFHIFIHLVSVDGTVVAPRTFQTM